MTFIQSRIKAVSPDAAAMKIREKYGDGQLTILETQPEFGIYEFVIEIKE